MRCLDKSRGFQGAVVFLGGRGRVEVQALERTREFPASRSGVMKRRGERDITSRHRPTWTLLFLYTYSLTVGILFSLFPFFFFVFRK